MSLTIIATVIAAPNDVELVKNELSKLVKETVKEAGCIRYDLHQDLANPAHFVFYECWESRELLEQHLQSAHIAAFSEVAKSGAVAKFEIQELAKL